METETGRIDALAGRLLDKVEQAIGELDTQTASRKIKTKSGGTEETWEYREILRTGTVDRAGLKVLTDLLKELQAITGGVPELERKEREARIESLRRGVGLQEVEDGQTGVILMPERKGLES